MPRWIASDPETAAAVGRRLSCAAPEMVAPVEALRLLLQSRESIALLACRSPHQAFIATIRKSSVVPERVPTLPSTREPRVVGSGFLGLVDEWEWDEEVKPKQSWWRKLMRLHRKIKVLRMDWSQRRRRFLLTLMRLQRMTHALWMGWLHRRRGFLRKLMRLQRTTQV